MASSGCAASRVAGAGALALLCFCIYLTNLRPLAAWDSTPARLLPFSILRQGNLDLNEFHWLFRIDPRPYFLYQAPGGRWFSRYSLATPVLVTPLYVPVVRWARRHRIDDDDVQFRLATVVMERVAAAAIAALSVGLVFIMLCDVTSPRMAAGITLAYALGTDTWVISSQALWEHGLAEVCLAGLSLFLLRADTHRNALAAGAFAALAVAARATMAVFTLLALLYMARERPRRLLTFSTLLIAGVLVQLFHSPHIPGLLRSLPRRGLFVFPRAGGLAGLLLSPSRGLLIYTPAALLALPLMLRPSARRPRWIAYLPWGVAGYLGLYSAWSGWWGGYCYGPRFLTDALPALALCAAPTVERFWRRRAGQVAVLALAAWGVAVQGIGVYCDDGSWDRFPASVDKRPERVWDWSDPQILRAARAGWHGDDLGPLLWQALTDPHPALLRPLTGADLAATIIARAPVPVRARVASRITLGLRVTNDATVTWPAFSDQGYLDCGLLYRWWQDAGVVPNEGGFVALPRNLGPGEPVTLQAQVTTPPHPGAYVLEFLVVQTFDPTRGVRGGASLRLPIAAN